MVGRDAFLVLNFRLDVFDSVAGLDFESDGFSRQGFDENLHATSKTKDQMKGRLFLDVVIRQGSAIFELLSRENETLLVGRDAFLVLNFRFHILNGVARLDFESDGFARQGFHENLHATSKTENEMKGRLFLDVVVA